MSLTDIYKKHYNISNEILDIAFKTEKQVSQFWSDIELKCETNSLKVLNSFRNNNISETHFNPSTGYGYGDVGRDTLDKVYAEVFGAQDAIVRHSIANGTCAISACLYGILRPGDTLVAATGKPYDTLEEVIGIRGGNNGSLKEFGINYKQVDLLPNGNVDFDSLRKAIDKSCRMVEIQRSKGYAWRQSFTISQIKEIIDFVKSIDKNIICMVDNCYGEFVETKEPTDVGADLIAGSLIKNPGGGIARTGGYVAGRSDLVELVSYRVTSPGVGREAGATLGENRFMYQGLFLAPHVVSQSLKAAVFCGALFENLGFETMPKKGEERTDIIQAIKFRASEKLISFCQGIQKGAPIDSFVSPMPWEMPGYDNKVIMAAGAFTQGSSIETSADGPLKEPYVAFYQGGLTYETAKAAILIAAQNVLKGAEQS